MSSSAYARRGVALLNIPQDVFGAKTSKAALSPATLRRRLASEHGENYVQVLNELRCDIARACLERSSISIDEIARRAGFAQNTSFCRAFRRWFGCTPAEYRRKHRNGSGYEPVTLYE